MHYPVTTEYGKNYKHMKQILKAISRIDMPKLIFWLMQTQVQKKFQLQLENIERKKLLKMLVC